MPVILDSLLSGPRTFVGDRLFYRGDIADPGLVTASALAWAKRCPEVLGYP